jgi:cyclic pyranopterin phosphate synthase
MSERVIPLVDQRIASLTAPVPAQPIVADGLLSDAWAAP